MDALLVNLFSLKIEQGCSVLIVTTKSRLRYSQRVNTTQNEPWYSVIIKNDHYFHENIKQK